MKKSKGTVFVVSAPSGAGKTTLCRELVARKSGLEFSISYTTREPRSGEVDGRDYSFVSREDFKTMADRGEFVEWAEVHGNLYGTSQRRLREMLDKGIDVIMDVDVQGASQLRNTVKEGVFIFILPPSRDDLIERLESRKSDSREVIQERLKNATAEIREYSLYDYVIVNDVFDKALGELWAIILSRGLHREKIDPEWVKNNFFRQEDS